MPAHSSQRPSRKQPTGSTVKNAAAASRVQNASIPVSVPVQVFDEKAAKFYDKSVAQVPAMFSSHSLRAAEAAQVPRSKRPRERENTNAADRFDKFCEDAHKNHDWEHTAGAIAKRDLKVTRAVVTAMRKNKRPLTVGDLRLLPVAFVRAEILDLLRSRGIEL